MSQALLSWPKASCHAGSRDWKNSSGWKKVRSVNAFTTRNAISRPKTPSVDSRWRPEEEWEDRERAPVLLGLVALADLLGGWGGIEQSDTPLQTTSTRPRPAMAAKGKVSSLQDGDDARR